jgi:sulfoxide reductase heme-binding subunit YedZ
MAVAVATHTHLFWITSRAAGTAALLLSSISVSVGLMIGAKLFKRRGPDLRVLHEALSMATLVAILVHAGSLLGDTYLHPSVLDLTVPLVSSYKTIWMSIGIVGGWSMVALGLSYYARSAIGQERWRILHRFTGLAWVLGIVHSFGEGTDAGQIWFLACTAIVVVPAVGMAFVRTMPSSSPPSARPAR